MSNARSLSWLGRDDGVLPTNVCRLGAVCALGMLLVVALLVLARRWAGALENPLGPGALLGVGALTAAAAVAIRLGWLLAPAAIAAPRLDRAVMLAALLAVLALGAGLCVPGTRGVAKLLLFAPLAIEEGWAWAWYLVREGGRQPAATRRTGWQPVVSRGTGWQPVLRDGLPAEDVVQQLTRSQAADGAESLSGWLRMPIAAGQRTGSVHVAFCPPLSATPEVLVEQIAGPEARVKTAQLLPYGVRLDLKLAAAAEEPTSVLLQFSARTAQ
jgi:hypothetical protein